ncbi:MAG: hypothetical protein MJ099_04105, partial [Clostridia bacterium]|nr:hypothetical protein [Clostridia bacterium]
PMGTFAYTTLEVEDADILNVTADGQLEALQLGSTDVTVHIPALDKHMTVTVTVVDELDGIELAAEKSTLELHETTVITCTLLPENAIGTGLVTMASQDDDIAYYDNEAGELVGLSYGTATIHAESGDTNVTAEISVNVLGGKRRLFVANYFANPKEWGYLPFSNNNANGIATVFGAAEVEGQHYQVTGPLTNVQRDSMLAQMDACFADATDDDISVIYICAHGAADTATGRYMFGVNENTGVNSAEIASHVRKIKGKIVFIMDSCSSGKLIDDLGGLIEEEGDRIAFLAAAHWDTSGCYWVGSDEQSSVDFFTHALLYGLGFNECRGFGGNPRGWLTSDEPADKNGDGLVTVAETFAYAQPQTVAFIQSARSSKQFRGNPAQVPQSAISAEMADLVLFARD